MAAAYANFFRLWKAEAARNSVAPQRLIFQQTSAPFNLQSTDSGMSPSQQMPAVIDTLGTSQSSSTSNIGSSSSDIVLRSPLLQVTGMRFSVRHLHVSRVPKKHPMRPPQQMSGPRHLPNRPGPQEVH
ncbi:hypothetical protein Pcinc_009114 [Petrolisthes cinctipes]|uniref:Uncharacterized protein n=1 Tax=Petrolisthes cinctipes TaxID=88211 RepID=A0AAE1KYT4_PETCI|nr:hypothetical protein Pcinc_009114 [Petrolisthes cinctipes]